MIKVGDKFILNNENWEVIFIDNDSVAVARSENGEEGIVSQRTIYKNWYEQQKQRADELEKRWNELRDTVNEFHQKAIFEESRSNDDADRGIIYACEKILGKMQQLQEDNNARSE